jgi:hypothetical protein
MDSSDFFGKCVGMVWNSLNESSKTLTQLQKDTGLTAREVSMGIGWLAKEGKIRITNPESMHVKFELID